jgi:hypothetical protein
MSLRLPVPIAAFAVLCTFAGGGPVLAQTRDQTLLAANGDAGAVMRAALHRPMAKASEELHGASFFGRWLLEVVADDAAPSALEEAWQAHKATVDAAIRTLPRERRAEVAAGLQSVLQAMSAYAFDRGHVREAFAACRETLASYRKKGGLYARNAWEAEQDLAETARRLGLYRNDLTLADDLWVAGGQPLLTAGLRVAGALRGELAPEVPAAGRAAETASR